MATVVPKQPKKDRDQITIRLDRDVLQDLEQYCRYLESGRDYVINQCLAFIFRKDKSFGIRLAGKGAVEATVTNGSAGESAAGKASARKSKPTVLQERLLIVE